MIPGLQPYPTYKDSGVPWVGKVPAHWQVAALRHRYSQCLGKMLDSKRITGNHSLPYLRNVDVQWDQINTKDLPTMDIPPDEYECFEQNLSETLDAAAPTSPQRRYRRTAGVSTPRPRPRQARYSSRLTYSSAP